MDKTIINNIRTLGIDMIKQAGSGHPGIVLGAAPIIYTLYSRHLKITKNPYSYNKDYFVLSAGHGSALLYANLYMAGLGLELEDLKRFRQLNSITPGHPEYKETPYVDATTGPLGQGIATSVGIAMGAKNRQTNNHIYALCGDGDLMEGVSYEACSLAGTLKLDNLIVLYDSNDICLDGTTNKVFNENIIKRFEAMNWYAETVLDGDNIDLIDQAITRAKKANKPSLIEIKTIIGKHSKLQGTNSVHGKVLDDEDISNIKTNLNINNESFYVNEEARKHYQNQIKYIESEDEYNVNVDIFDKIDFSDIDETEELRAINGKVLNKISEYLPTLIGGSADLSSSTKAYIKNNNSFNEDTDNYNIFYGVREHAMASISNGLAINGFIPFCSTFLTFSDYMKPAIRIAALSNLKVIYMFTHDSINIGQDGPTHQPIEHLTMLRTIPNLTVYRPCNLNEIIDTYKSILKNDNPAAIVLSRASGLHNLESKLELGAYPITNKDNYDATILATGKEVELAYNIAMKLSNESIKLRVVSIPSIEIFNNQSEEYINTILDKTKPIFALEYGSSYSWYQYIQNKNYLFTLDTFGKSAKTNDVEHYFKLDLDNIVKRIKDII